MKNITSIREETIMYFVYFADHYLEDEDFEDANCIPFYDKERAIGAAMALLSVVKGVQYACICKAITRLDDEDVECQFIWEATADDSDSDEQLGEYTDKSMFS